LSTGSAPAYRARETFGLLQHETPDFISPSLTYGHLTARPKSYELHGVGIDGAARLPEHE